MGRVICSVVAAAGLFCLGLGQKLEVKGEELRAPGVPTSLEAFARLKTWFRAFGRTIPNETVRLVYGGPKYGDSWRYAVDSTRDSLRTNIAFECFATGTLFTDEVRMNEPGRASNFSDDQMRKAANDFMIAIEPSLKPKVRSGEMHLETSKVDAQICVEAVEYQNQVEVVGNTYSLYFSPVSGKICHAEVRRPLATFEEEKKPRLTPEDAHARAKEVLRKYEKSWDYADFFLTATSSRYLHLVYWNPESYAKPGKARLFYMLDRLYSPSSFLLIDAKTGDVWYFENNPTPGAPRKL